GLRIAALPAAGADVSVEVADADGENPPEDRFKLVVRQGDKVVETYDVSTRKNVKNYVVTQVAERSKLIQGTEQSGAPVARPDKQSVRLPAAGSETTTEVARINASEYLGDPEARTGFGGLEAIDEITMVAVPDLMSAYQRGMLDLKAVKTVQLAVISHCEQMG